MGSEPSHIVHARMIGDVRLRDDKGTRDDPDDDLRVGPMAHLEYDEKTLQITTDSDVFLQDRDLTLTGLGGMMIQLRRKAPTPGEPPSPGGAGFDAESASVLQGHPHRRQERRLHRHPARHRQAREGRARPRSTSGPTAR